MACLAHHFLTMAYNNAWANHRLLQACLQLTPADFAAPGFTEAQIRGST